MIYLELLGMVLLVNIAPAFVPPTWTILVYFIVKHNLYLPLVVLCGVTAATFGRYILSKYIGVISHSLFNDEQIENIGYLGKRLGKTKKANFFFTFLYSLTPLSTTALFVAAGVAKIRMDVVLSGFFLGRVISYTVLATSARALSHSMISIDGGGLTWDSVAKILFASIVFLIFIFIDWKTLLEKKKIRIKWHIWRWSKKKN